MERPAAAMMLVNTLTGLYYYGYRWYAPNLQRWVNRDPIQEEGGINLYRFAQNDSVNFVDLFGLDVEFVKSPSCTDAQLKKVKDAYENVKSTKRGGELADKLEKSKKKYKIIAAPGGHDPWQSDVGDWIVVDPDKTPTYDTPYGKSSSISRKSSGARDGPCLRR